MFGPDAAFIFMPRAMDALGYASGNTICRHSFTWTIKDGYGSNYGKQTMDPGDF